MRASRLAGLPVRVENSRSSRRRASATASAWTARRTRLVPTSEEIGQTAISAARAKASESRSASATLRRARPEATASSALIQALVSRAYVAACQPIIAGSV